MWNNGQIVFHLTTHITPQIAHVTADSSTLAAIPISNESGFTHFTSTYCS